MQTYPCCHKGPRFLEICCLVAESRCEQSRSHHWKGSPLVHLVDSLTVSTVNDFSPPNTDLHRLQFQQQTSPKGVCTKPWRFSVRSLGSSWPWMSKPATAQGVHSMLNLLMPFWVEYSTSQHPKGGGTSKRSPDKLGNVSLLGSKGEPNRLAFPRFFWGLPFESDPGRQPLEASPVLDPKGEIKKGDVGLELGRLRPEERQTQRTWTWKMVATVKL